MKLNWGYKIAIFYIAFMVFVALIVAFSFTQDVNLVTENYYEEEVKYQEHIDKVKRTEALPQQLLIQVENEFIALTFPELFKETKIDGKIQLYRPSDNKFDQTISIDVNSSNQQLIAKSDLQSGLWKIKIFWNVNTTEYYNEKLLMIN